MSSYRGGQRRDNQRNSSSNYGSGSGNLYSRRQSYGSSNQVNPWQGGVVPGGNQLGGLGLLPTPSQSGVLNQLSSPEAQLAMATNLLNKILSPQQSQSSSVPSLLSLPINRSFNDYGSRGTYSDRRRDRLGDRRVQPYNKSGLNRRGDVKSRLGKSRISDKSSSSAKSKKRDTDDNDKDGENQNGEGSEDNEKRGDGDDKKDDDDKSSVLGEKYAEVPQSLLSCHVCHKKMWDACSFEKHVSGRRHQMMMEQLDESYKIKVELLRHEQRADESQREMEIERLELQGKKIFNNKREYCTMCDLHFYGNLISHRKKDRHQKLKAFLHPKCHLCHKEFPNRLEWDDHKLSAGHLLKVADYYRTTKPGVKVEEMEDNDTESIDGDVFDELVDDVHFMKQRKDIDLTNFPTTIEEYNSEEPLGTDFVVPVQGHLCKLCNKFISTDEEAVTHTRTLTHYKNYANVSKLKAKAEKEKEAAEKAAEMKAKAEEMRREKKKIKEGEELDAKDEDGDAKDWEGVEGEVKMEVDGSDGLKAEGKKEQYDPDKSGEDTDTKAEDDDEEEKSTEEGSPTRGRNQPARRGRTRRGK